ncbi:unnamed protein product [Sphagnum tenellum]
MGKFSELIHSTSIQLPDFCCPPKQPDGPAFKHHDGNGQVTLSGLPLRWASSTNLLATSSASGMDCTIDTASWFGTTLHSPAVAKTRKSIPSSIVTLAIASHGTSLSDKAMADAADVVDGASMAEECPTTLTPPSPPVLFFNQNVAADINVWHLGVNVALVILLRLQWMTCCEEHPTRKMLLVAMEPAEPNPHCYVCSETPLVLEVNTVTATMKDVIEKMLKRKLGIDSPVIMQGSSLLYEIGDDLEEDMAAYYASLLNKSLASYPTPITIGVVLTVEDYHQDFRCSLHVKHRFGFESIFLVPVVNTDDTLQPKIVVDEDLSNKVENGHGKDDDDDDMVMFTPETLAGAKRKPEEEESLQVEKRLKIEQLPAMS